MEFFLTIAFVVLYSVVGFGAYRFCRLLSENIDYFDLLSDELALGDDLEKLGVTIWIIAWPFLISIYLVVHLTILFIATLCCIGLTIWIVVLPHRAPKGFYER